MGTAILQAELRFVSAAFVKDVLPSACDIGAGEKDSAVRDRLQKKQRSPSLCVLRCGWSCRNGGMQWN
jgi:hypothetical protein